MGWAIFQRENLRHRRWIARIRRQPIDGLGGQSDDPSGQPGLRLGQQPLRDVRETLPRNAAARRSEAAEIELVDFHVAAEAKPPGFLHDLAEQHLRPHAFRCCLVIENRAEIAQGGCPATA